MSKKERQIKSARKDGRGGRLPGVRLNPDCGDWARVLIDLQALVNEHHKHGVISFRACARDLNVSDITVRRWVSGVDRPSVATQEAVRQWIADRRRGVA